MNPLIPLEIDYAETQRRIKTLIKERGLSIREVMNQLGFINPNDLLLRPSLEMLICLSHILDVPLADLMALKNQEPPSDRSAQ